MKVLNHFSRCSWRRVSRFGDFIAVFHYESIEECRFNILHVGEEARQSRLRFRSKRIDMVNLASYSALKTAAERNVPLG